MTMTIMPQGRQRYYDNDGNLAVGCLLYAFAAGTTTPQATYQDAAGTVPHAHPIVLDAKGEAVIYWSGSYKVDLKTDVGVQITGWPVDNVRAPVTPGDLSVVGGSGLIGFAYATAYGVGTIGRWLKDLALSTGSAFIGFIQAGVGAVLRTIQAELRDWIKPKQFGAVGDGVADDFAALQKTITQAFALGVPQTIYLNGGTYMVSAPLVYPAGGHVTLCGGTIKAGPAFDVTRDLLECTNQSGGLVHHDLTFRDLTLDANHRGGCLQIDNYIRVAIDNCKFLHFSTQGLWLRKTIDSHEGMINKCWAFEYLYGESGYTTPTATSVGFQVDSFDNHIMGAVSYYTGTGMVVNGQYNLISQPHLGGVTYGLVITDNAAFSSFMQPYIDSAAVLWKNPWNSEIIGGKFLHNTANAAFTFIVLKPLSAGIAINGLKIKECSFHNIDATVVNSVTVDTAAGSFSAALVLNCQIESNSFVHTTYAYTRFTSSIFQAAATVWTFNVGAYLPIGTVQLAKHSYFAQTTPAAVSNITDITGNVVTITNTLAGNGTVFLEVDVNTGTN